MAAQQHGHRPKYQRRTTDLLTGPLTRLQNQPGLDLQQGLAALQGNQSKYVALLRHFASEHNQDMQLLESHLHAGDRLAASRLLHTLRGWPAPLGWWNWPPRANNWSRSWPTTVRH